MAFNRSFLQLCNCVRRVALNNCNIESKGRLIANSMNVFTLGQRFSSVTSQGVDVSLFDKGERLADILESGIEKNKRKLELISRSLNIECPIKQHHVHLCGVIDSLFDADCFFNQKKNLLFEKKSDFVHWLNMLDVEQLLFIGALFGPDIIEPDLRTEELNYMCDKLQLVTDLKGNEQFNNFSWEMQLMYSFIYVALDEKSSNFIATSRYLLNNIKQLLDNQESELQSELREMSMFLFDSANSYKVDQCLTRYGNLCEKLLLRQNLELLLVTNSSDVRGSQLIDYVKIFNLKSSD